MAPQTVYLPKVCFCVLAELCFVLRRAEKSMYRTLAHYSTSCLGYMDMKDLQVLLMILTAAVGLNAQSYHLGSCPQSSVQVDFNITKYMGTWYEIEKLPAMFERGKCIQATYSLLSDGTVHVHNAELLPTGRINSIDGVAKVKDSSQPAILEVSFVKGLSDSPYWVLASDYQSYSLVYSCFEYVGLFHIDFAWILARTRVLSKDMLAHLHEKLAAAGVNVNHLTVTNQTGCNVFT